MATHVACRPFLTQIPCVGKKFLLLAFKWETTSTAVGNRNHLPPHLGHSHNGCMKPGKEKEGTLFNPFRFFEPFAILTCRPPPFLQPQTTAQQPSITLQAPHNRSRPLKLSYNPYANPSRPIGNIQPNLRHPPPHPDPQENFHSCCAGDLSHYGSMQGPVFFQLAWFLVMCCVYTIYPNRFVRSAPRCGVAIYEVHQAYEVHPNRKGWQPPKKHGGKPQNRANKKITKILASFPISPTGK